jgi:RimJ/RimL family protein N-acetyltransferase
MNAPLLPEQLRTERLWLRRWHPGDAAALLPVLEANAAYLLAWIPEHVGSPAPLPQLEARLTGFSAAFEDGREWRYGVFSPDQATLIGEVSLFPRNATGRRRAVESDRLEIGYWIRADWAGRGYATEAARAMVELSSTIPGMVRVEIRCDPRNLASAAVPRRLGFRLEAGEPEPGLMVWVLDLPR